MYGKILQRLLQNFFLTMGRAPITPNEWSRLRKQAMELARKEGGDPITGAGIGTPPKSLMDTTKDLPGISSLQNNPKIIPFPKQKSRNMTPLKRTMSNPGIRGLMMKGNVRLGEAPKTLKSTLDQKKAAYEGHVNKEMWVKNKIQQNKDAIERFKTKFGKKEPTTVEDFTKKGDWDPSGMAEGGIAPLIGEPSYAADFYDDRIPYAAGKIVKGGRWFLKNLKRSLNEIETSPRFKNLSPEKKEVVTAEIKNLIKSVEGGGPIPDEMIQTIRSDPKFFEVSKTRSTDPDLYDFEQVVLDYKADKQARQIVDEVFGKDHPAVKDRPHPHDDWEGEAWDRGRDVVDSLTGPKEIKRRKELEILEKFDPTKRRPNFLGGRVSYSGGGRAGLPAITYGMSQMNMQGPQMPAAPQPQGISGVNLQLNQMNLDYNKNQMMQSPYMPTGGQPYGGQLRMPFAGGGMGRRAFLKLMAGLGALPFFGRGTKKAAPVAEKITEKVIERGPDGMPSYLPDLIEVVKMKGIRSIEEGFKKSDYSTKHSYKGVEVVERPNGTISVRTDVEGVGADDAGEMFDGITRQMEMEIVPGEYIQKGSTVSDDAAKVVKEPDQYFEYTAKPDMDGKMKDVEEYIDDIDHEGFKEIAEEIKEIPGYPLRDKQGLASGGIARLGFSEGEFGMPKKKVSGAEILEKHTDYIEKANKIKQAEADAKKQEERAKYSDLLKYDTGNEIRPDMDMLLRQAMQYVPEKERKLVDTMIAELLLIYPDRERPTTINEVKQLINQAKVEGKFEKKLFNEKLALSATKILDTAQDKTLLSIQSPLLNISGDLDRDTYNISKDLKLGNVDLGYDTTFAEGDQIGSTYSLDVPIKYKDLEGDLEVKRRDNKYNTTDSVDFDTKLKKGNFTAGLTGNVEKDKYGITTALDPSLQYNIDTDYGSLSALAKKNIMEGGDWEGDISYSIGDSGHPAEKDQYWRLSANVDPFEGDKKAMLLFKSKFAKGGLARLLGE